MNLHFYIDQIVVTGIDLPRSQRPQLQAAIEAELQHLFMTQGIPTNLREGGAISRLPVSLERGGQAGHASLGQDVARSIYVNLQSDQFHN